MKRKIKAFAVVFSFFAFNVVFFQNCAKTPLGSLNVGADLSSLSPATDANVVTVPFALLTSEQLLKSMSSMTGVTPSTGIMNEYNARNSLFASGYQLDLVTSPMMIGITNLSSTFCNQLITDEMNPANTRRFFASIDFAKPVTALTDASFEAAFQKLSSSFWGRSANEEESQTLKTGKTEFLSALTDTEMKSTASTRNLMLFTCTGMLSSFDSITF